MRRRKRRGNTIMTIALISALIIISLIPLPVAEATSFTVSKSNITLENGKSSTITINAPTHTGRVDITSSNSGVATANESSLWVENNSKTITISAKSAGTAVITVKGELFDDATGEEAEFVRTIKVTVNKASSSDSNSNVGNTAGGSTNENTSNNNQNSNAGTTGSGGNSSNGSTGGNQSNGSSGNTNASVSGSTSSSGQNPNTTSKPSTNGTTSSTTSKPATSVPSGSSSTTIQNNTTVREPNSEENIQTEENNVETIFSEEENLEKEEISEEETEQESNDIIVEESESQQATIQQSNSANINKKSGIITGVAIVAIATIGIGIGVSKKIFKK